MTSTDEFVLAEQMPGSVPAGRRRLPPHARASTWAIVGVLLVFVGVLTSPGPQYPRLEDGIAWNVLDLDLASEPEVTWSVDLTVNEMLGDVGGMLVVREEGEWLGEDMPPVIFHGLDPGDGRERWQLEDTERTCQVGAAAVTCTVQRSTPGASIVVHPTDGGPSVSADHPGAMTALLLDDGGMLVVEGGTTALAELGAVRRDGRRAVALTVGLLRHGGRQFLLS